MPDTAPLTTKLETTLPATGAAADYDQTIDTAPFAGTVTGIDYVPEAAITGNSTDSRTLTVVNKGQSGAGTTVVGTLAFIATVNGVAFDAKAFTLSAVAGATTIAAGDVLAAVSTHVSATGLADPGGRVIVTLSRG